MLMMHSGSLTSQDDQRMFVNTLYKLIASRADCIYQFFGCIKKSKYIGKRLIYKIHNKQKQICSRISARTWQLVLAVI